MNSHGKNDQSHIAPKRCSKHDCIDVGSLAVGDDRYLIRNSNGFDQNMNACFHYVVTILLQ